LQACSKRKVERRIFHHPTKAKTQSTRQYASLNTFSPHSTQEWRIPHQDSAKQQNAFNVTIRNRNNKTLLNTKNSCTLNVM